jgi:serine/threonine protein kinase
MRHDEWVAGTVVDSYRIVEKLGEGGMGQVYKAVDSRLGRAVAIKVISRELAHDEKFEKRFEREARAAAALSHPNVVGIHGFGGSARPPRVPTWPSSSCRAVRSTRS